MDEAIQYTGIYAHPPGVTVDTTSTVSINKVLDDLPTKSAGEWSGIIYSKIRVTATQKKSSKFPDAVARIDKTYKYFEKDASPSYFLDKSAPAGEIVSQTASTLSDSKAPEGQSIAKNMTTSTAPSVREIDPHTQSLLGFRRPFVAVPDPFRYNGQGQQVNSLGRVIHGLKMQELFDPISVMDRFGQLNTNVDKRNSQIFPTAMPMY